MSEKFHFLKNPQLYLKLLLLTAGAIIYGMGVALFIDPYDFVPGGLTGVAVFLNRYVNVQTGTLVVCFNIPLMFLAFKRFRLKFVFSTLYVILLSSSVMNLIDAMKIPHVTEEKVLAAVFGGLLASVGIGLAFHGGGSTGGTDIIVKALRQRYKHLKSGAIFMMADMAVIALSIIAFGVPSALYACVSAVVSATVLDLVLYGRDEAKFVFIVASNPAAVSGRLLVEANVGVTLFTGTGAYSGVERQIMMCVFHRHLYPRVKAIVYEEDPGAFMIVTSASETYGQGFKRPSAEEL